MSKGKGRELDSVLATAVSSYRYSVEIGQILAVAGDISEPLEETRQLVEDLVRSQVIELAIRARLAAQRRRSRSLATEDILFVLRDDRAKLDRLRSFLSWRNLRRSFQDHADGTVGGVYNQDNLDFDVSAERLTERPRREGIRLPWEVTSVFKDILHQHRRGLRAANAGSSSRTVESDEDEDEWDAPNLNEEELQRLKEANEVTKDMTSKAWENYTEARKASFTHRKVKRFRDFVNLAPYLEVKPSDDIIELLGYLCKELVQTLCRRALAVKAALELASRPSSSSSSTAATSRDGSKRRRLLDESAAISGSELAPVSCGLFAPPRETKTPLRPAHIRKAYAMLQREAKAKKECGLGRNKIRTRGEARIELI